MNHRFDKLSHGSRNGTCRGSALRVCERMGTGTSPHVLFPANDLYGPEPVPILSQTPREHGQDRRWSAGARWTVAGLLLLVGQSAWGIDLQEDPKPRAYFYAEGMRLPQSLRVKVFRPDAKRANFTLFDGVADVAVADGKLAFTLTRPKATLGWGNYAGQQAIAAVEDMWQQENAVRLRLRQSADRSDWTARLWRDGGRVELPHSEKKQPTATTVAGQGWQEIVFGPLASRGANPDGLEFTIEGSPGTRIEIEWLKLEQRVQEGFRRGEFVLPEGRVWRAVANVGSMNDRNWYGIDQMSSRLHINGKLVPRGGIGHLYRASGVDIGPYLKAGRNCVGMYGFRIGRDSPLLYFQAKVIMESGQVITVTSGREWKYSPREVKGWSLPGLDDSLWPKLAGGASPILAGEGNLPTYDGRLVIKKPDGKSLFYADTADVLVDVHVPRGLKDARPVLAYVFGAADAEGRCRTAADGSVATYSEQAGSLVYRINLRRHTHGVYALALSLSGADGGLIEQRCREPLVVVRKMPLRTAAADDSLNHGLDMELEDEIDFTRADDPHPWFESTSPAKLLSAPAEKVERPVIVRRGGLAYREVAGATRGSGFSYRIQFKHPGSFYYMEMEYPDDAKRTIEVQISSKYENVWTNSQSGVGAETGGHFLPTGKMARLAWIHVGDPGPHSVDVINVVSGEKAAARSLRIYRIRGDLPAAASGVNRSYGIHTERCYYTSGIGMNFGVGMPTQPAARAGAEKPPIERLLQDLAWLEPTCERYVQYLKYTGQNCHVMGCYQYNDYNSPYLPAPKLDDSRVLHCMRTMLANVLELNGIDFYAGVEFSQSQDARSYANDAQVARGADTMWMVTARGQQWYGFDLPTMVPNWLHPDVAGSYRQIAEDLADTFGHLSRFRGIHGMLGPMQRSAYWVPGFGWEWDFDRPLEASFDDITIGLFERESGITIPISKTDPRRFAMRAALLKSPALREPFFAWRGKKSAQFCAQVVGSLRRHRSDLQLVNVLGIEGSQFYRYLVESHRPFASILKDFAIDIDQLNRVAGMRIGRWTTSWQQPTRFDTPSQDPYCRLAQTSPEIAASMAAEANRYVLVRTSWDESLFPYRGLTVPERGRTDTLVESDWIMNTERIRTLPQPGGYHCREAYLQAIVASDPNLVLGGFTDLNINVGHEEVLRGLLTTYTHLPRERFREVLGTGLRTDLAIRQLDQADKCYFYVANPCQWHVQGRILLATDGRVREFPGGKPVGVGRQAGAVEVPVQLTPYGIAAFEVNSPRLQITSYRIDPLTPDEMARLQAVVDRVDRLLAHPRVCLSVAPVDRRFLRNALAGARAAIGRRQYAEAWSAITHWRFWTRWQDYLEVAAATAGPPTPCEPTIRYDQARNCIQLIGFPEESPATPDAILEADRRNAWGRVRYDASTDTYTIDAAVWIGDDQSNGTLLQIGDKKHPRVTVVVRGTVWVRPPQESPLRSDGRESILNNLTLGDPQDATIRATLKIDCETRGQHGVYVGYRSDQSKVWSHRGSLCVYNSTITAARPDKQHAWGKMDYTEPGASPRWSSPGWYGSEIRLVGATISWFDGCPSYGAVTGAPGPDNSLGSMQSSRWHVIENSTFEHGGSAVANSQQYVKNCTFRDLQSAVAEGGALSAKLVHCVFEDNQSHWTLGSMGSGGIVAVDCDFGAQKNPIEIRKNKISAEEAVRRRVPLCPEVLQRQSLVVRVVDRQQRPVAGAAVVVSAPDAGQVTRGATLTDQNGQTAADPEADAIVVTNRKLQATDDSQRPAVSTFSYQVTVSRPGLPPQTVALPAGQPIPRPLVVRLE